MPKKKIRKLTNKEKGDIWSKRDWEGSDFVESGYALAEFHGTEFEERIKKLTEEMQWFNDMVNEWEEYAGEDEE